MEGRRIQWTETADLEWKVGESLGLKLRPQPARPRARADPKLQRLQKRRLDSARQAARARADPKLQRLQNRRLDSARPPARG